MNPLSSRISFLLAAVFLLAVAGCSGSKAPDKFIEVGRKLYREHNYLKAKEQFQSALQLRPDSRIAAGYIGKILYRQGQVFEALPFINGGLRAMTNDVELHEFKSVVLLRRRDSNAPIFIQKTLALSPTNDTALGLLPEAFGTNGEPAVLSLLQSLSQRAGDYPGYDVVRSVLAFRRKDAAGGVRELEKALQKDRNFVPALILGGNIHLAYGRTNQALESFKAAASVSPPYAEARTIYASALFRAGQDDAAIKVLDEVIQQAPERTVAYILRAEMALSQKKPEEVIKILEPALSQAPNDYGSRLLQGKAYFQLKQYTNVLQSYAYIAPRASRNYEFHFTAAESLINLKQYTNAIIALERAYLSNTNDFNAPNLLAELKLLLNRPMEAVDLLSRVTSYGTNAFRSYQLLGKAYLQAGRLDEALDVFEGMKKRGIESATLFYDTGIIHRSFADEAQTRITEATEAGQAAPLENLRNRRQRETAMARRDFRRSLAINPKSLEALEANVDLELREGDPAAAKKFLEPFIREIDGSERLLYLRARVSLAEKKRESAEADLGRALELNPAFYPAYHQLAEIYLNARNLEESLKQIDLVLQPQGTNAALIAIAKAQRPRFLILRGMVCSELGRHEDAVAAYRELIQGGSQNVLVLNNLAYALGEKLGKVDEARPIAQKVWELAPDNFLHSDTLGWIEYRRGEFAKALQLLDQSQASLGNRSFSRFAQDADTRADVDAHYGHANYMMGFETAAFTALERTRKSLTNKTLLDLTLPRLEFLSRLRDPSLKDPEPVVQARLQQDPKDIIALMRLARIREAAGNTAGALEQYAVALQVNPHLTEATIQSALIQVESAPDVAAQLARRAQSAGSDDPRIGVVLGRTTLKTGDVKRALPLLQAGVQSITNNPVLWYDLARAEFALGNLRSALAAANNASQLAPSGPLATGVRDLVDWLTLARDPAAAAANTAKIEAAVKSAPDNLSARYALTVALTHAKKDAEARDLLEAIRKVHPEFLIATRDLAVLYGTSLANDAKALDLGSSARARFQDDTTLARVLGLAAHRRGDHRYAAQLLSELVDNGSEDAEVQFRLGSSLFSLRRFEEARAVLQKAVSLAPNAPFVPEAQRMLKDPKAG